MSYNSIRPGQVWLDTNGNRIQAHGGSILYVDGTYYWYGENKEKTTSENDIWHWGVRCYASTDLYNWEDKGLIIPPEPDDPKSSMHPSSQMDRPHIIYNKDTKKYVAWLKIMHRDGTQTETVMTADDILGPYEKVREGLKPLNMSAGDFDLAVAPDGKAYYYFERVHSETICADLTPDYTDVTGYYSTHFPHTQPPYVREATAHFYRKGKHYLLTSGTTGYLPNPSEVWPIHGTVRIQCWEIPIQEMRATPPSIPRSLPYSRCRVKKTCTSPVLTDGCLCIWTENMKNMPQSSKRSSAVM